MKCTLATKAPEWNVVMYNDKTKAYFVSPLAEWKGAQSSLKNSAKTRQAYSRATTSLIEKPPHKVRDELILGHKTSLYLTDNLVTTGLKKVEFSITPEIEAPPQLQQVFGKIYGVGLTKLKGLPLKVSYIDENGKRSPVFETRRISKKEIPINYFSVPPNYRRVDSEIAVLMDQKGRETMAAIMDDPGEGGEGEELDTLLDEDGKISSGEQNLQNSKNRKPRSESSTLGKNFDNLRRERQQASTRKESPSSPVSDFVIEHDPTVALTKAGALHRPMLIIIVQSDMPGCKLFESSILSESSVRTYLSENVVVVRIEANSPLASTLHERCKLPGLPAFVLMTPDKVIRGSTVGLPPSPSAFIDSIKKLSNSLFRLRGRSPARALE